MNLKLQIKWRDIFSFSLGLTISIVLCNWTYFKFSKEINTTEIFTALFGGFIVWQVGSKIASNVSSNRVEKDLLIEELKSVRSDISKLTNLLESEVVPQSIAVNLFKNSSKGLTEIKEMALLCRYGNEVVEQINKILSNVRSLNQGVTKNSPYSATNENLNFKEDEILVLVNESSNIGKMIMKLIVQINRLDK